MMVDTINMTGVLVRGGRDTRDMHTEKGPSENAARRHLSASPAGRPLWRETYSAVTLILDFQPPQL